MSAPNKTERTSMAKVQKSLLLNEGLAKLVQLVEERSGATFTRIMTAALVRYLFDGLENPEPAAMFGPDPVWMRVAVALERGALTVDDIPDEMFDVAIRSAENLTKGQAPVSDDASQRDLQNRLSARRRAKQEFNVKVESLGGKHQAIVDVLEWRYSK